MVIQILGVGDMTKFLYHDIVIFALYKVFMISHFLIPYKFHNSCPQCQYHSVKKTNTSLNKKQLKRTEDK